MPFTLEKLVRWTPDLADLVGESRRLPNVPPDEARLFHDWVDWMSDRLRFHEITGLVARLGSVPVGLLGYRRHGGVVRVSYLYVHAAHRAALGWMLHEAEARWHGARRVVIEGGPQTFLDEAVGVEGFAEAGYQRFQRARLERVFDDTLDVAVQPGIAPLPLEDHAALLALQSVGYEGGPDALLIDDPETMLHELLGDPWFEPSLSYAVRDGAGLAAALYTFNKGRVAWIASLCVHPNARGRGLARRLMLHAMAAYRDAGFARVGLNVTLANDPAKRLYEQMGFSISERRSLLYVRELHPPNGAPTR